MSLRLLTPPDEEPITLAEARAQCRIDTTDEDSLLSVFIGAARKRAEQLTGRAFITQSWERALDAFPEVEIKLGKAPVESVLSVEYIDTAGMTRSVDPSAYVLDNIREPGWLLPAAGYSWPTAADGANVVRVSFSCGYGATAAAVASVLPQLRQWMLMEVAAAYKHREAFASGVSLSELPGRYHDGLLDDLLVYR